MFVTSLGADLVVHFPQQPECLGRMSGQATSPFCPRARHNVGFELSQETTRKFHVLISPRPEEANFSLVPFTEDGRKGRESSNSRKRRDPSTSPWQEQVAAEQELCPQV